MSKKIVTLTLTVEADTDTQAWIEFENMFRRGDYDSDSIEIEEEGDME